MTEYSLENLKDKFHTKVIGKWHREGREGNDGSAGNTLEDLLDVAENNIRLPDWGAIELKTKKKESMSLITLMHREPQPAASIPRLLLSLGWTHKDAGVKYPIDELSFRSTTRADSFSDRGFAIKICEERVTFVFDPSKVNINCSDRTSVYATYGEWLQDIEDRSPNYRDVLPVYWDKSYVLSEIKSKLDNTLFVLVESKKIDGVKFFKYCSAVLFSGFNPSKFDLLFRDQMLYVDFDARTRHNHGTKFRVDFRGISKMFDRSVLIY